MGGNGKKWVWSIKLQESKIKCISGMKSWNKLIFCYKFRKAKGCFNGFWVLGRCGLYDHKTLKSVVSLDWLISHSISLTFKYWWFKAVVLVVLMHIMIPEIVNILIKFQPVLLTKLSLMKDMQCSFKEITFSCTFSVCLSCISFGQYFQINIFKSEKKMKSALTI